MIERTEGDVVIELKILLKIIKRQYCNEPNKTTSTSAFGRIQKILCGDFDSKLLDDTSRKLKLKKVRKRQNKTPDYWYTQQRFPGNTYASVLVKTTTKKVKNQRRRGIG